MPISLIEFLQPARRGPQKVLCLGTLYYFAVFKDQAAMSVGEIKSALVSARIPNAARMNVAAVVSAAGSAVDTSDVNARGARLWHLTTTGLALVRKQLGLPEEQPEIAYDVNTLRKLSAGLSDSIIRGFVDEAILCLEVGALRAAMVFLWSGAVRTLQNKATSAGWPAVTAACQKHDTRIKPLKKFEDFANVNDKTLLLALRELAVLDKSQWTILQGDLDLRNQCGHPTRYKPGAKKVSAFVEDMIGLAFTT